MPICVNVAEVWLSPFLPLEEKVANYPPQADARDDDSSNAADTKKLSRILPDQFYMFRCRIKIGAFTISPACNAA